MIILAALLACLAACAPQPGLPTPTAPNRATLTPWIFHTSTPPIEPTVQPVSLDEVLRSCQQVGLTGFAEVNFPQAVAMIFYYLGGEVNALYREGSVAYHGTTALDRGGRFDHDAHGDVTVDELILAGETLVLVAMSALVGIVPHWRAGRERFAPGIVFGLAGVGGSLETMLLSEHPDIAKTLSRQIARNTTQASTVLGFSKIRALIPRGG